LSRAATGAGDGSAQSGEIPACQVIDVGPAAEELLMESGWTVRWASVRALGVVGLGQANVLAPLGVAMQDEQWQIRGIAALAVGQFGDQATPVAVAALAGVLGDEHPAVRKAATIALGEIGPTARTTLTALRVATEDEDEAVRAAAVLAIDNVSANP
jgi:HEAT repeat protein